jgi:hypothetical protein
MTAPPSAPIDQQCSAPMKPLCRFMEDDKPCRWYWAGRGFVRPGLYLWLWGKNWRLLPWPTH